MPLQEEEDTNTTDTWSYDLGAPIDDAGGANNTFERKTPLQILLISGLKRSKLLRAKLPEVRRLAMIETILDQQVDDKETLAIVLGNVQTSPYISKEEFQDVVLQVLQSSKMPLESNVANDMAAMVLDGNWNGFLTLASSEEVKDSFAEQGRRSILRMFSLKRRQDASNRRLRDYRNMVVKILSSSRRIATMRATRRRHLGNKIHSARSIDEIKKIAFYHLDTSNIIVEESERQEIRDNVANGRYDLLLLPKFFDCEEIPRSRNAAYGNYTHLEAQTQEEEEDEDDDDDENECVICLGAINPDEQTVLSCNHSFCTECIQNWMATSSTCPICRAPLGTQQRRHILGQEGVSAGVGRGRGRGRGRIRGLPMPSIVSDESPLLTNTMHSEGTPRHSTRGQPESLLVGWIVLALVAGGISAVLLLFILVFFFWLLFQLQ